MSGSLCDIRSSAPQVPCGVRAPATMVIIVLVFTVVAFYGGGEVMAIRLLASAGLYRWQWLFWSCA